MSNFPNSHFHLVCPQRSDCLGRHPHLTCLQRSRTTTVGLHHHPPRPCLHRQSPQRVCLWQISTKQTHLEDALFHFWLCSQFIYLGGFDCSHWHSQSLFPSILRTNRRWRLMALGCQDDTVIMVSSAKFYQKY